jgi:RNA polymerase sigma factor
LKREGGGVVIFFVKRRIQERVCYVQDQGNEEEIHDLLEELQPHLLRIGRSVLKKSVTLQDDEYSILLNAAHKAIETYNRNDAKFFTYLQTVVTNALLSHIRIEQKRQERIVYPSFEDGAPILGQTFEQSIEEKLIVQEEMKEFKEKLAEYGLTLQQLFDARPKQEQKRIRLKQIALHIHELGLADWFLSSTTPSRKIAEQVGVTQRYLKQNRTFLVGMVLILKEDYSTLKFWQKGGADYEKRSCR